MEQPAKKPKKCTMTEEDGAAILERYSAETVVTLLGEVSQCAEEEKKIDWNGLVERTATGITNAREMQMLWRHIAYRHDLPETFEDGAQPLDDDSDLEMELEAFPPVNAEASAEAAACVKLLMASAAASEANPGSTVEAPLIITVPDIRTRNVDQPNCSMQRRKIVVPVCVPKQPAPTTVSTDGFDKRKRKPWTEAEDSELIAGVQKHGEGNWGNIVKGDFKWDRTASQLSQNVQRWPIIRKRLGHRNGNGSGSGSGSVSGNGNGNINVRSSSSSNVAQLSEAQLAARHAVSLALDMPVKNLTSSLVGQAGAIGANKSFGSNSKANAIRTNGANASPLTPGTAAEPSSMTSNRVLPSQKPSQENVSSKPSLIGSAGPAEKPRLPVKTPMLKATSTPCSSDAMVRATAVAAGARIASPSDAATLLKAAQGKNAIHIMPSGAGGSSGSGIKSSMPGGPTSISEALPNVHYIRSGLAQTALSSYAGATPNVPSPGPVNKVVPPPPVKPVQTANVKSFDGNLKQASNELPLKKEVKKIGESLVAEPVSAVTKEQVQGGVGARLSEKSLELVQDTRRAPPVPSAGVKVAPGNAAALVSSLNSKRAELCSMSRTENSVNSSSLKTTDLKGVSISKNPISPFNPKAVADSKVTAGTPSLVSSLQTKPPELKGRNSAQTPVSSVTSKTAELKGTNSNPISPLASKTTEIKGTVGSKNPLSLSTLKTTEIKGSNGSQKPISSSSSKVAEIKGTTGAQNPISLSALKSAELKGTNGAKNSVPTLVSKTSELKTTSSVQNPVGSSTSKTVVMKSTISSPNPVCSPVSKAAEAKGTSGSQSQVGASTLKATEFKGTKGGQNPVSALILRTSELKGTNGSQKPVSAPTLKTTESKGTNSGQNPAGTSTSTTTESKGTNSGQNPAGPSTSTTTESKGTNSGQNPAGTSASKTTESKGTNGSQNPVLKTSELKITTGAPNPVGSTGAPNPVSSPTSGGLRKNEVNTHPKNAGASVNDAKTPASQVGAIQSTEKGVQNRKIVNTTEVDSRSIATDVAKNGEKVNVDTMDMDVPAKT